MSLTLLIIDPQRDFCDPSEGTLFVPHADQDMKRLAAMIRRHGDKIDAIHVTLDTHHVVDIAHPIFWHDATGRQPEPFTIIRAADVDAGVWRVARPELQMRAGDYVHALEATGRYQLCIWPYHCLEGSAGHAVHPDLFSALVQWEQRFAIVDYIRKGSNIFTEHYSAIRAEVPDPTDPSTQVNTALIETLRQADRVLIAGEAGSHCVANTVRDLADSLGNPDDNRAISRLTLLTDAVSPVSGFEALQEQFIETLAARGMRLSTTSDAFASDVNRSF